MKKELYLQKQTSQMKQNVLKLNVNTFTLTKFRKKFAVDGTTSWKSSRLLFWRHFSQNYDSQIWATNFVFSKQKIHQKWLFTLMLWKKDQISSDSEIIQYQRLFHCAANAASRVFLLNKAPIVSRFICVSKKIASYKFCSRRHTNRVDFSGAIFAIASVLAASRIMDRVIVPCTLVISGIFHEPALSHRKCDNSSSIAGIAHDEKSPNNLVSLNDL